MFLSTVAYDFEKNWQDRLKNQSKPTPERKDFIFLAVDVVNGDLSALEPEEISASVALQEMSVPYPWNRRVWAEAINRLGDAGVRMILIDIFFPGPSGDPEADEALAEALERHRDRVVISSQWTPIDERSMKYMDPYELLLRGEGQPRGFVNFWPDPVDDIFRIADYRLTPNEAGGTERHKDETVYESLSAVAARKMGVKDIPNRAMLRLAGWDQGGSIRAGQAYPPRSLHTIFAQREWEANYKNGKYFEGKAVMLGPANPIFNDEVTTSSGKVYGAQLHMQSLACLLERAFWREPPESWNWFAMVGMAGVAFLLSSSLRSPLAVLGLAVVVGVALVFGSAYAANASSVLFTGFSGLLGLGFVTISCEGTEFFFEQKERKQLHRQLSRSVSPDVAEAMVRAPEGYLDTARGGRRTVAILFSDVRNFTARSERMEPEALVEQLNAYFTKMVESVFECGGSIDKFIGDAVMASWGGLLDLSEAEMAKAALKSAGQMSLRLEELNKGWEEVGLEGFEVGIGIHIGDAVVGEIGSKERSDFTAIGDAVNVAARIEGMTKQLGVGLLVSGRASAAAGEGLYSVGMFRVKGREEPLEVCTTGKDSSGWEAAMEGLRRGDEAPMRELAGGSGEWAGPARFYVRWMEGLGGSVPAGWDGVVTLDSK